MMFRPRLPFLGLVAGAIAGIVASEKCPVSSAWTLALTIGLGVVVAIRPRTWLAIWFVAAGFHFLHTLRHLESSPARLAREFATSTVTADGIVWDEPRKWAEGETTFLLRAQLLGESVLDAGFIRVRTVGETPSCGDRVRIRGVANVPRAPRNPAEFDGAEWSARQGISLELRCEFAPDFEVVEHDVARTATRLASRARAWIREQLAAGVSGSQEQVALIESMVLGVNAETPPEMRDLFQKTGTLHLLAVSGLNVAMLAQIILMLLRPFGIKRVLAVVVTIVFLSFYALITGLSPSCTRATLMAAFLLAAPCFDRSASPMNSLAAAAFTLLAWDTNQLFSVGFQLSFFIVFVLFLCARRIQDRVTPLAFPDEFLPRKLWSPVQQFRVWIWSGFAVAVGVNLASWFGSLFITVGYFHIISPVAIVANFIAVLIAFAVLALGLASILAAAVPAVAVLFNHANVACATGLLGVVGVFSKVPHGHSYVELPQFGPTPLCELTILDLGEGSATHIRAGKSDWLIDSGHLRDYSRTLSPYLRSRGIDQLDALLLTHGDASHIGGASPLLLEFAPQNWIEGCLADRSPTRRALHEELAKRQYGRMLCTAGDSWNLDPNVKVTILFPPPELERSVADDQAIVCMLEVASNRILLMSDAGFSTEKWLTENVPDIRATVVVKGWHDKDSAGSADFITRLSPSLVIVGDQRFGTSQDKTEKWAAPLRERGITVFSQGVTGAVRLKVSHAGFIEAVPQLKVAADFKYPGP